MANVVELPLHEVQGNLLRGYRYRHVAHVFGEVVPGDEKARSLWREFFKKLPVSFTSAHEEHRKTNVGLSFRAVSSLVPSLGAEIASHFEAFSEGMPARASALGDGDAFKQDVWNRRDVWISLHADTSTELETAKRDLLALVRELGLKDELQGTAIVNDHGHWAEHFGFRDDISYPAFEGMPGLTAEEIKGRGKQIAGEWQALAAGEFVLGQKDELGRDASSGLSVDAQRLLRNGTFAAFRHLQQHVDAFREYTERHSVGKVDVAESLMGRKRNGEPLVKPAATATGDSKLSDFDYRDDPNGAQCPMGSHVRRMNPRGEDGRHRLIRRGIPFGKPLEEGEKESESEPLGLLFVAFNADLSDQFEFVQKVWANGKLPNNVPNARDPIGSALPKRSMMIEGDVTSGRLPRPLLNIPSFVTCLGGQYYLYPGASGLDLLGGK